MRHAPTLSFLLVEGQELVREGLRLLLKAHWPDLPVREFPTLREAIETLPGVPGRPLVLVDTDQAGDDWREALASLSDTHPETLTVVLSTCGTEEQVAEALGLGAVGYVPKAASPERFVEALHQVAAGHVYLPPAGLGAQDKEEHSDETVPLTPRQRELLPLIARGMVNKQIAERMGISEGTVKLHLRALFRTLGVRNRAQAVWVARRHLRGEQ